jgi:hypothetical protein
MDRMINTYEIVILDFSVHLNDAEGATISIVSFSTFLQLALALLQGEKMRLESN